MSCQLLILIPKGLAFVLSKLAAFLSSITRTVCGFLALLAAGTPSSGSFLSLFPTIFLRQSH